MSESPRVSLMKMRQKRKPKKLKTEKYQIDPCTSKVLLIIYSKVREMIVRLIN